MKKQKEIIIAPEHQRIEKLCKKVFGGKCGYQRVGKNTELALMGAVSSIWEIDKFSTIGRTQRYLGEKIYEEDGPLTLEIYNKSGKDGWSITDDELTYYFFVYNKIAYMVRSNWLWNLSGRIQDYIIENQKIQKWMQGIKRSSSLKTKIEIDFGVPCLPVSFEAELKSDGSKLDVLIDWKVAMNYLKMDIEKIKL